MSHTPEVSVVVPVYNGERFLAAALESALRQTVSPREVIVVDDGSTDGSAQVAEGLGVRCLRQANGGPAAARNRGLAAAGGEFIALLDADDLWPADHLAVLLERFAAEPRLAVALGRVQVVDTGAGGDLLPLGPPAWSLLLGAALFHRRAFDEVGPFDPSFRIGDDTDWFLRALEHDLRMAAIEAVTLLYRLHDANLTLNERERRRTFVRILKLSLDRRRRAHGGVARPLPRIPGCGSIDAALRSMLGLRRRKLAAP